MTTKQISAKLDLLPESSKKEVNDFIDFLILKLSKKDSIPPAPKFGSAKGFYEMADDFDEPLEDFEEYMQ